MVIAVWILFTDNAGYLLALLVLRPKGRHNLKIKK